MLSAGSQNLLDHGVRVTYDEGSSQDYSINITYDCWQPIILALKRESHTSPSLFAPIPFLAYYLKILRMRSKVKLYIFKSADQLEGFVHVLNHVCCWMIRVVPLFLLKKTSPHKDRVPTLSVSPFYVSLWVIANHVIVAYLYFFILSLLFKERLCIIKGKSLGLSIHCVLQVFKPVEVLHDLLEAVDEDALAMAWDFELVSICQIRVGEIKLNKLRIGFLSL